MTDIICVKQQSTGNAVFFTGSTDGRITAFKTSGDAFEMIDSKQPDSPSPVNTLCSIGETMVIGGC